MRFAMDSPSLVLALQHRAPDAEYRYRVMWQDGIGSRV